MVNLDQGGFAAGYTVVQPPPPDLAHLVECTFLRRDDAARATRARGWRLVPEANANIVVVARGATIDAGIVGARSRFCDTTASDRRFTVGVRFHPGALSSIVRDRATAFTDRRLELDDVFGAAGRRAMARLDPATPDGVPTVVFDLLREARTYERSHLRMFAALASASSVSELAATLGMPVRTLHARTLESIGLAPKVLLRILRLHRALEAHESKVGWADVAASAGFADQPHLVREIRALLGESPREWISRRSADSFKTTRTIRH